jgi:hypothetical protein
MTAPGSFLLINVTQYTHLPTTFKLRKSKDIQKRQIMNFKSPGYSSFSMSLTQNNIQSGTHTLKNPP